MERTFKWEPVAVGEGSCFSLNRIVINTFSDSLRIFQPNKQGFVKTLDTFRLQRDCHAFAKNFYWWLVESSKLRSFKQLRTTQYFKVRICFSWFDFPCLTKKTLPFCLSLSNLKILRNPYIILLTRKRNSRTAATVSRSYWTHIHSTKTWSRLRIVGEIKFRLLYQYT